MAAAISRVDGARLCLWTAATNGSIVHPPGDIWVWTARRMVYLQAETEELGENLSQNHAGHIPHGLTRGTN
jgi:hypothetical protein